MIPKRNKTKISRRDEITKIREEIKTKKIYKGSIKQRVIFKK
jgi:hypothetical protein